MKYVNNPIYFNNCVKLMRHFFSSRGFIEIQNTRNVLDIENLSVSTNAFDKKWNVGQIWMEELLLNNIDGDGYFAITVDVDNNAMFEFTSKGNIDNLISINKDLLQNIGFKLYESLQNNCDQTRYKMHQFPYSHGMMGEYGQLIDWGRSRNFDELYPDCSTTHPKNIQKIGSNKDNKSGYYVDNCDRIHYPEYDHDDILRSSGKDYEFFDTDDELFLVKNFPSSSNPYWNIAMQDGYQKRVDVILYDKRVVSSVEKSCDKVQMKHLFDIIMDNICIDSDENHDNKNNKQIIETVFEQYIEQDFFPRYGGKIDINNMIRALAKRNLINKDSD
jgi:hypothetical protein